MFWHKPRTTTCDNIVVDVVDEKVGNSGGDEYFLNVVKNTCLTFGTRLVFFDDGEKSAVAYDNP